MSCSLSHAIEEIKEYVQKQCDIDDAARQEAIIAVSKLFNKEYHVKQALEEQYACRMQRHSARETCYSSFKKVSIKERFSCGMSLHSSYVFHRSSLAVLALSYSTA
ncbi:hypothetical protein Tco_1305120, partial [Tanacetum coccineum]